ncbi:sarcoplasmic reticulum histidine-rich calcium-binding protein-like [Eleutherodactylus coqui]|uniref:sarcoplasmic reticulum histidine-rich calcium-binding protein-like n=1 Tax=Eleutherodactylus coqui TaxID=57060 RepID=UPI003462646D
MGHRETVSKKESKTSPSHYIYHRTQGDRQQEGEQDISKALHIPWGTGSPSARRGARHLQAITYTIGHRETVSKKGTKTSPSHYIYHGAQGDRQQEGEQDISKALHIPWRTGRPSARRGARHLQGITYTMEDRETVSKKGSKTSPRHYIYHGGQGDRQQEGEQDISKPLHIPWRTGRPSARRGARHLQAITYTIGHRETVSKKGTKTSPSHYIYHGAQGDRQQEGEQDISKALHIPWRTGRPSARRGARHLQAITYTMGHRETVSKKGSKTSPRHYIYHGGQGDRQQEGEQDISKPLHIPWRTGRPSARRGARHLQGITYTLEDRETVSKKVTKTSPSYYIYHRTQVDRQQEGDQDISKRLHIPWGTGRPSARR